MRVITDLPPINVLEPAMVVAHAVQSDKMTRWYRAPLLAGTAPWTPPTNGQGTVKFQKADGHGGWYETMEDGSVAVTNDGSTVTFGMAEQALSYPGNVNVAIGWYTPAGEFLTSFKVIIVVDEDPSKTYMSTDYYNVLSIEMAAILSYAESLSGIEAEAHNIAIGSDATVEITGGTEGNPYHLDFGIPSGPIESLTAEAYGLPTGSSPEIEVTGGGTTPFNINFGIPVGSVGPAGVSVQDEEPVNGELLWVDTDEYADTVVIPEINDSIVSDVDGWSSQKIQNEIEEVRGEILGYSVVHTW